MVDVLTRVLSKVIASLRVNGTLLLIQPISSNKIIEVEIDNHIVFREELKEPCFLEYLKATMEVVNNAIKDRLLEKKFELVTPEDDYFCDGYDSVQQWEKDATDCCDDLTTFNEMLKRVQKLIAGRKHRILEYWREETLLLRKIG